MADHSETGAFNINGQWVTAIRYEASLDATGALASAKVVFLNGRRRVDTAELPTRQAALALLGERNVAAIEAGTGMDKGARREAPRGRLQGHTLAFHAADTRGLEAVALRSIERRNEALLALPRDVLEEPRARELVRDDLAALHAIKSETERAFAAAAMGDTAHTQAAYQAELLRQDAQLSRQVAAAFDGEQRRIAAKEERKAAELEAMATRGGIAAEPRIDVHDRHERAGGRSTEDLASNASAPEAFSIDGQRVTGIRYEARVKDARASEMELKFVNGGTEIAAFKGEREQGLALLGAHNLAAIESAAGERDDHIEGELRGTKLHPRAARLPELAAEQVRDANPGATGAEENAIERGVLLRSKVRDERPEVAGTASSPPHGAAAADATVEREAPQDDPASIRPNAYPIPAELEQRFIRVEDRFYFPDRSLAFVDRGTRLKAETENVEVIRGLVQIAHARGWDAIRVTGTDTFRSKVWHEAARHGIAVRGYAPSDLERAQLARERGEPSEGTRAPKSHDSGLERPLVLAERLRPTIGDSARDDNPAPPARGQGQRAATQPSPTASPDVIFGKLIETGEAPYRFQDNAGQSSYIRIATDKGERVLWGVDFPRAVSEAQTQPRPGDPVGVQYLGKRAVTVKVPVKDKDGSVKAYKEISAHRNTWAVEKPAYYEARNVRAAAIRNTEIAREQLVESHPELAAAITWIHLAERLAQRSIADTRDQERFVAMVREGLAQTIGRSQPLAPPKLRVVAPTEPERNDDRVAAAPTSRIPEKTMVR